MTEYRVKEIRPSTPEELEAHEQQKQARAYAVARAKRQNPGLKFETWEELMALPMNAVSRETFSEILESGLVGDPVERDV